MRFLQRLTRHTSDETPSVSLDDNGDLVLTVGDLAPEIMDRLGSAICPRSLSMNRRSLVKRETVRCFVNKVQRLMQIIQEGGRANRVQYIDPWQLPDPLDNILENPDGFTQGPRAKIVQDGYSETESTAKTLLLRPDAPNDTRERVRKWSNLVVFAEGVGNYAFADGKMVVKKAFWEQHLEWSDEEGEEEEEEETCPTEPQDILICSSCGGNSLDDAQSKSIGKCVGVSILIPMAAPCDFFH